MKRILLFALALARTACFVKSAPHGAGRSLSRSQAFATLSMDEFEKSMEGVYTTSVDESTLDEAPSAYKNADSVIATLAPTVEIEEIVKPVYNFKASKLRKRKAEQDEEDEEVSSTNPESCF